MYRFNLNFNVLNRQITRSRNILDWKIVNKINELYLITMSLSRKRVSNWFELDHRVIF